MPLLPSNPEITIASVAERPHLIGEFERGVLAYIRAQGLESGTIYHAFVPHGTNPVMVEVGLILDEIASEPIHPLYFGNRAELTEFEQNYGAANLEVLPEQHEMAVQPVMN